MRQINRRENPRIDIQLRCHVTSPAVWMRGSMYTENISRNGLLIAWCGEDGNVPPPSMGQIVTVEVELPSNHEFGPKCIHCQGFVARILDGLDGPRIALRLNYMDFRSFHDRIRSMQAMEPVVTAWMA